MAGTQNISHKLCCRTSCYGQYSGDLDRVASDLQENGIRWIEIPLPAVEEIGSTLAWWSTFGISPLSVIGKADFADGPLFVQRIEDQCRIASALGASYLFLSLKRGDIPEQEVYSLLQRAGDRAARQDVTVVLETHPDLATNAEIALATMTGVDHPSIRINFDTANIFFYNRGCTAEGELEKILPWVASVHLKDTNGVYQAWHFPALGEGVVKFRRIIEMLDSRGYRGPYTLELEGIKNEEPSWDLYSSRVADSVQYLRSLNLGF